MLEPLLRPILRPPIEDDLAALSTGGGVAKPSAAQLATAQKLVNAQAAWSAKTFRSTTPVMTVRAAFATSSRLFNEPGSPNVPYNDAALRCSVPLNPAGANVYDGAYGGNLTQGAYLFDGGVNWAELLRVINARYIEAAVIFGSDTVGQKNMMQLQIGGQWARSTDYEMFNSGTPSDQLDRPHFVSFDLGAEYTGEVSLHFGQYARIIGLNVARATSGVAATWAAPTLAAGYVIGRMMGCDSLSADFGTPMFTSLGYQYLDKMGARIPVQSARSGQGFTRATDGLFTHQRVAIDASKFSIRAPDLETFYVGPNDAGADPATVAARAALAAQSIRANNPDCWISAFTSFGGIGGATISSALNNAVRDALLALNDPALVVTDTIAEGYEITDVTGNMANGQPHDSPDGVHKGTNQRAEASSRMVASTIAKIKAKAGIA